MWQIQLGIFNQRVELEADIAIVAAAGLPGGQERLLCFADQLIGQFPGNGFIVFAGIDQLSNEDHGKVPEFAAPRKAPFDPFAQTQGERARQHEQRELVGVMHGYGWDERDVRGTGN